MKVVKIESRPGRGVRRLETTDHDDASLEGAVVIARKRRSARARHASSAARSFFLPELLLSCTSLHVEEEQ